MRHLAWTNSKKHIGRLHFSRRSKALDVDGKVEVVAKGMKAHKKQIERIEVLEPLAESVSQIKAGKVRDARKAMGKLIAGLTI